MNDLKSALFQQCSAFINSRILAAEQAIAAARDAANNDTKSSAGDKYETGRAMMQQEIDRNSRQLLEAQKLSQVILKIDTLQQSEVVQLGSIVITDQGNFFISIGAGKLIHKAEEYFAVSSASPIGLALSGQKTGNSLRFNGKSYLIKDIL
jgi:transcription elongation GreA/GreB family factor